MNEEDPTPFAPVSDTAIQGCGDTSLFDNSGRSRDDDCAVKLRSVTNAQWADHQLYNSAQCTHDLAKDRLTDFAMCHRNLRFKNGIGNVPFCSVDDDSRIRKEGYDVRRKRFQLFPREFRAVPDMGKGDFLPDIDSMLSRGYQMGHDKRPALATHTDCEHLSEVELDRFVPMLPCIRSTVQDARNIVPTWTWGGDPSRLVNRSSEFLQACGFELADERRQTWVAGERQ